MRLQGGDPPETDETMQHERCVLQVLRRHFERYTPEVVADICGCSPQDLLEVADALIDNSGRERTSAVVYAVGWTQHTVGVQNIRTAAIIQLLLGNIGRPGGGILALRGHANIQGSTDIPTLYNILPGYIPMPHPHEHPGLDTFVKENGPDTGVWGDLRPYIVSLLKAWWGDAAVEENDFCFRYLPRIDGDHSHYAMMLKMLDGGVRGMLCVGQNPAVGSANSRLMRLALAKLDWLVVRDMQMVESATFWQDSPEHESGEVRAQDIATEVFFLPAAAHTEKEGNFTNTQRLLQWRHKAVEPPGDCRSELHWIYHLGRAIREKLAGSDDPKDRPVLDLTWEYPVAGPHDEPSAEAVLQEISGRHADGSFIASYDNLQPDGSTRCGSWIHCGIFKDGVNQSARRRPHHEQNWIAREWGWAWPKDIRIIYNRASADPAGRPWSERKKYLWWDAAAGEWASLGDAPDFPPTKAPDYTPPERGQEDGRRSPGTSPSHCTPTAAAGCTSRTAWSTARCRSTTSRMSHRFRTDSTVRIGTPPASASPGRRTATTPPRARAAVTCSRSCSPPIGSPSTTQPAACPAPLGTSPSSSPSSSARSRRSSPALAACTTANGRRSSPRAVAWRPA